MHRLQAEGPEERGPVVTLSEMLFTILERFPDSVDVRRSAKAVRGNRKHPPRVYFDLPDDWVKAMTGRAGRTPDDLILLRLAGPAVEAVQKCEKASKPMRPSEVRAAAEQTKLNIAATKLRIVVDAALDAVDEIRTGDEEAIQAAADDLESALKDVL